MPLLCHAGMGMVRALQILSSLRLAGSVHHLAELDLALCRPLLHLSAEVPLHLACQQAFLRADTGQAIQTQQWPALMIIYGVGFVAVYTIFLLLYAHAYRKRDELELNEVEVSKTKEAILAFLLLLGIGFTLILIAALGGKQYVNWSGWIYLSIIPMDFINGYVTKKRRKALQTKLVTRGEAETNKISS